LIDDLGKKESINEFFLEIKEIKNKYPTLKNVKKEQINKMENQFEELE
jgi:hypothetical protein